jgi:Tol biopolymer transport system component
VLTWPADLPSLAELWSDRSQNEILIEGEWVIPIFNQFSLQLGQRVFQEEGETYAVIARPILPHETPDSFGFLPAPPRYYTPVLNCDGQPTFISQTATPTLTSPAARLSGQGRIVFVSGAYKDQEIFMSEADGSNRFRLTNNLFADYDPVWSPDGQRIAFVSERGGNQDIFVMNADGRNLTQLTNHENNDYSPTWSPDGTKIAFVSEREGSWTKSEIFVMNPDGSGQERLTENQIRETHPVWSPDGRKIALVMTLGVQSEKLAVLYLESGMIEELMPESVRTISRPAWSPDSWQIAIAISNVREEVIIRAVDLEGEEIQNVVVPTLQFLSSLDWSADGSHIVFSAKEPMEGGDEPYISDNHPYSGNWGIFAVDLTTELIIQITYTEQIEVSPSWWP